MSVNSSYQIREKAAFPVIRELLSGLIYRYYQEGYGGNMSLNELTKFILQGIEHLRHSIFNYGDGEIAEILKEPKCELTNSNDKLDATIEKLKDRWYSPNEFFTIFNIASGKEIYVDERIKEIIGIDPADFRTAVLDINNPSASIYFEEDVYHVLRFGLISYFMLSLPGFKWSSKSDHTLTRFRLNTSRSKIEAIRKLPYLAVEKRCYLFYDNVSHDIGMPQHHFDLLSVYPHLPINNVTCTFITNDRQGAFINCFTYVINLFLIDITPKYVLLLDERQRHDRNKSIAHSLSDAIKDKTGKLFQIDEQQVADCFAKTIRPKVENAYNTWDFRKLTNRIKINSDTEAVLYAKKLGLLPIPPMVKDILFEMVISS